MNHFNIEPASYTEVYKALKAIHTKKSAGPEPYLLKITDDISTEPVTHIFNLSFLTNSTPSIWKSAYVLPDAINYCPISKPPILAKVYESLVNSQLKHFLIENNILSGVQSGFRSRHSTITAAMAVAKDIINALDKKQCCAALFVDVDHELLQARLCLWKLTMNCC